VPLSILACDKAWLRVRTRRFCGNECAVIQSVSRSFSSAHHVIADTVIAVRLAVNRCDGNNGSGPTYGTSKAQKDDSIIATVSGNTGCAAGPCQQA
jgi:hypothetical protein